MIATRQVEKNPEAVLYYLYMMADGEISYSEEKIFDVLCKEMNVVEDDQKEIQEECQRLAPEKSYVLYQLYESSLLKQLEDKRTLFWKLTKWEKREIIWNLINIGYADSEYSEDEKKIVDFLLQKWEISRTFYQELIDIAVNLGDANDIFGSKLATEKGYAWQSYFFCKLFHQSRFPDTRCAPDEYRSAWCYVE